MKPIRKYRGIDSKRIKTQSLVFPNERSLFMPNGPTSQQLRKWYKNFSELLLKNADIDVTNPAHLGLVKNIQVTKWDTTNPDTPDVKIDYAYLASLPLRLWLLFLR